MHGITVFPTCKAAVNAGYEIYDKTKNGWLARTKTTAGWAMAIVEPKKKALA